MGSINVIVTIMNMRAPGMDLMKMPLFVWSWLITSYLLIAVMPVLGWSSDNDANGYSFWYKFF